jgi:hypothetical protein
LSGIATEPVHSLSCDSPDGRITIEEACLRVAANAPVIEEQEEIPLGKALGRTVAEPVTAVLPLPLSDQSAMDGYWRIAVPEDCLVPRILDLEDVASRARRGSGHGWPGRRGPTSMGIKALC